MCSIILATRLFAGTPIVVGANREERWDRPARPPAHLDATPPVFAPRDVEAGGTWIGTNAAGLLAAITNRPADLAGERSRGLLLRDVLANTACDDALGTVQTELAAGSYAGFNLVVATSQAAALVEWDGSLARTSLAPGLHVVVNRGHHETVAKAATIRARLQRSAMDGADAMTDRLMTVLRDHANRVCVHDERGGTRSSSIVQVDRDRSVLWRYANGPPCEHEYRPVLEGEL